MPKSDLLAAMESRLLLFVSYTPAGEGWASWIAWELESAGYRVVLQAWDFVPDTNFVDFMDRGVAGGHSRPSPRGQALAVRPRRDVAAIDSQRQQVREGIRGAGERGDAQRGQGSRVLVVVGRRALV